MRVLLLDCSQSMAWKKSSLSGAATVVKDETRPVETIERDKERRHRMKTWSLVLAVALIALGLLLAFAQQSNMMWILSEAAIAKRCLFAGGGGGEACGYAFGVALGSFLPLILVGAGVSLYRSGQGAARKPNDNRQAP